MLFTKWWIVDVVDGTDGIMYGFPFIYKSPAFYTSMAVEYFIAELIVDFVIYFGLFFGLFYMINRFIIEIKSRKMVSVILFIIAFLLIGSELLLAFMPENKVSLKRDFDIVIKKTGLEYPFNNEDEWKFNDYHK